MPNIEFEEISILVNKIHLGDCLSVMKRFPDKSINAVITSPAYWQLRNYGWAGQWGLEPTYPMYLENLWSLMDEIWRVLKDDGTVWINLGDTYSTQSGTNTAIAKGTHTKQKSTYLVNRGASGLLMKDKSLPNKCLMLIPHRFAIGCIDKGWIMRNDIIWAKRNGMPESVKDRFSKKHEYFFFMVKNEKYYFDLDGIKDKIKTASIERALRGVSETNKWVNGVDGQAPHNLSKPRPNITTKIPKENHQMFGSPRARQHRQSNGKSVFGGIKGDGQDPNGIYSGKEWFPNPDGKNPGSVSDFWDIPTIGSKDAHYASYNTKLIDKPIVAGCPPGGIILDPFCGTATTGCRAIELGRKFIGIEGSEKYVQIANKKLHPFLIAQQLF